MAQERNVIAESNVSEVLREPVSQTTTRLTDVQRRVELGDTVNDIDRSAGKRFRDVIRTIMGTCENGGVGEAGANAAAWVGDGERDKLEDESLEETVD